MEPPLVAILKQARHEVEMGNFELAQAGYGKAIEAAVSSAEPDAPLLRYFSLRGYADTTATPNFSPEELDRLRDASERARVARDDAFVRQWWARVERFKGALTKSRIERLEHEIARGTYETKAFSLSNSGWQLDVIRQEAVKRGAPLAVEKELTLDLLEAYDSGYEELEERLRLGLEKTGQWLSRQVTSGDLFRRRSRTVFADRLQAGALDRTDGVQEVSKRLFPQVVGKSVVRRRVVVDVLKSIPRILRQTDIPLAIAEIALTRDGDASIPLGETLASLAQVCSWQDVKGQILPALNEVSLLDLQYSAQKFPWEHWITCDDFLARGGDAFLERLITGSELGLLQRISVGWALVLALAAAPEDTRLVELCGQYASLAFKHMDQERSDREQLVNFVAHSPEFATKNPDVTNKLSDLLNQGDRTVIRILGGSLPDSVWGDRARGMFGLDAASQSQGSATLEEVVLASVLDKERRIDWATIRRHLDASWDGLPELAPILTRERWSPGEWKEMQTMLRVGGHRGKSGSWLLARLGLLLDALEHEPARSALFDDSPEGLGFLRHALVDAVAGGDATLANNAIYGLASLAIHVRSDAEADAIAAALLAAADDVRINVAHGAAFVAHYLIEGSSGRHFHEQIMAVASRVALDMHGDPLAVVQRQAVFGAAKGRQAAERHRREDLAKE